MDTSLIMYVWINWSVLDPLLSYLPLTSFYTAALWRHQMETFSALLDICAGWDSAHKDQWRGALMFSVICAWRNGWVYNGETGDLRPHRAHYDVIVMLWYTVRTSFVRDKDLPYRKYLSHHTSRHYITHYGHGSRETMLGASHRSCICLDICKQRAMPIKAA